MTSIYTCDRNTPTRLPEELAAEGPGHFILISNPSRSYEVTISGKQTSVTQRRPHTCLTGLEQ